MRNYVSSTEEELTDWLNGDDEDAAPPAPGGDSAEDGGADPVDDPVQVCPYADTQSDHKKSLYIDVTWTYSGGAPRGTYRIDIAGAQINGALDSGRIRINEELESLCGDGELEITIENGPVFTAPLTLGLPAVQTPEGVKRRLTNLGYFAGVDARFDQRAAWAVRAFKRRAMNGDIRNRTEPETDQLTQAFATALRDAYGGHPGDVPADAAPAALIPGDCGACGMFGARVLTRGGFEDRAVANDRDPSGAGGGGVWAGGAIAGVAEPIAGTFRLHLRAFDPHGGDLVIPNTVALPQPVHMLQFVLFELGFWVVGGTYEASGAGTASTKLRFAADGGFGPDTHWALREFQCSAKAAQTAMEDVASIDLRYLPRLFALSPAANDGPGRYPDAGRVSGALNAATRAALQHWADQRRRCPVVVYSSSDTNNPVANGADMSKLQRENLWKYDDHPATAPRVFAIDYSGRYTIPADHGGTVTAGGAIFPRPITVGGYISTFQGGPATLPKYGQTWNSEHAEVLPNTMVDTADPGDGSALTVAQLSTFKVVRTAAHFECLGFFDTLNAYDDVVISFGPCHWTLARGGGGGDRDEPREMPAMLAYFRSIHPAGYEEFFGRFGLIPQGTWPLTMGTQTGTYNTRIEIQTETGMVNLSGVHGSDDDGRRENRYCKTWHSYYRFQMACRTSADLRDAMWGFSRIRLRDIMDKTFVIGGVARRVGDYATSEKSAAMLLRWHIYRPAHLFRTNANHLLPALTAVIATGLPDNDARETALINEIVTQATTAFGAGDNLPQALSSIRGWTNVPQTGTRSYYDLNLADPVLNDGAGSFEFEAP